MAYSMASIFKLGSGNTGLTLEVQLKDTGNNNVGAPITTTFFELGNGEYAWYTAAIPDGHRGWGLVQNTVGHAFLTAFSINPEELEYTDAKISTINDVASGLPNRILVDSGILYVYYYNTDADAQNDASRVYKRRLFTVTGTNPTNIAQVHGVGKLENA